MRRGWVVGLVLFVGGHPAVTAPSIGAPAGTCTLQGLIRTKGNARGPVVVYLKGHGPPATAPSTEVVSQRNKAFSTPSVVVATGASVSFPNRDAVYHHLYSPSSDDPFQFPAHATGAMPSRSFNKSGGHLVRCKIHPDMETQILVLPNGWAAETDNKGFYKITGITPGRHSAEAWSARQTPESFDFSCRAGEIVQFSATLPYRRPVLGANYLDGNGD